MRAGLADPRVSAAQRAQIRAALAFAQSAGAQALCLTRQPAGAGEQAPEAPIKKGCRVSDLAAVAQNTSLPASIRASARRQLAAARASGVKSLCTSPRPAHSTPAKTIARDPRSCSLETYRRALGDPSLTAAEKRQIQEYLNLLAAQHRAQPYC